MNSRAFTLSLVIAGIAMFMTYTYIEGEKNALIQKYGKNVPVVIAKVDIKELELIDDRKVQVITVPANYKAPNAFTKKADVFNTVATVPINRGEQITTPRVTFPGARTGLSRQVSVGKRALSIQVTEDSAVGKLIKPGDRVDVLALMDYAGGKLNKMKVKTILQDKYILATGFNVTNTLPLVGVKTDNEIKKMKLTTYTSFNTVTLELEPYEVEKLLFLMKVGTGIYLSLRNTDDQKIQQISGTNYFDLLGEDGSDAKQYFIEKSNLKKQRKN
jgi:pilus assembly protein CpaB